MFLESLNAPSGAGCFLTGKGPCYVRSHHVFMHLLVLGAF